MEPYKFKKIKFNDGILNDSVDATYIIHLENNGRYEHIQEQLKEYHPTNIVYILFNKGYKKSKKKPFINSPPLDLIDAFLEIFKHAEKHNYNNILILEDDFIFSEKIKDSEHQVNINNTLIKLENTDFIYLLGCVPFIQLPYDLYSYRIISGGTHAVIYSKQNRINTLKINQEEIKDWDSYNNKNINRITYNIPLCYQLFPETENSKVWGKNVNNFLHLLCKCFIQRVKYLNLDIKTEPGTSILYYLSRSSSFIIISLFLLFIINKLIQNDFKSILGLIFIIVSIHRIILKKERLIEISNNNLPNYCQYIIIIYEFITGFLLLFNTQYTDIILKLLLLVLIIGSIIIVINHTQKILSTYKDVWTFKPSMSGLIIHILIIFIIIINLKFQ